MGNQVKKICVVVGSRAEEGLTAPIRRRIEASSRLELQTLNVKGYSFVGAYDRACAHFFYHRPDLVLVPCDRLEAFAVAAAAHYSNIPLIHLHAGDYSEGTWDDMARHAISLLANVHFCNGAPSYLRTCQLLESVGRSTKHVYEVGSTAFDDLKIDNSIVPDEPFDLVLYNPPTLHPERIEEELDEIVSLLDKLTIWVGPNLDAGSETIINRVQGLISEKIRFWRNMPRPKFLALMQMCERFIGNSSSQTYEAPFFHTKCVHIGVRNKGREPIEIRLGGSDRIVKILEEIELNDL